MRQHALKLVALMSVGVCLSMVGSLVQPSTASAACSVTPNYPIQRYLGSYQWAMWGHAYLSGCGGATVSLFLCEDLGHWYCSGRNDIVRNGQNGNYTSLRVVVTDCRRYQGSGRIATGWRINGGTRHVSTRVGRVC
jgi:hypothetical protein